MIAKDAGATVIRHNTNMGYGASIITLFDAAKKKNADIVVTLDSDEQHDVNDIPKILDPILKQDADIVIGSRFLTKKDSQKIPKYRKFGIKTITKLTQMVSHSNITDSQSGFRAYNKNALEKLDLYEKGMSISTEILFRIKEKNLQIKEVPITIRYDVENASTHHPLKHGISVINSILQFITLRHPLTFYGLPGIGFLIIGIFFMSSALDVFSASRYVSTPTILVSLGCVIVGMILLATSVILYTIIALLRGKINN